MKLEDIDKVKDLIKKGDTLYANFQLVSEEGVGGFITVIDEKVYLSNEESVTFYNTVTNKYRKMFKYIKTSLKDLGVTDIEKHWNIKDE